MNKCRPCALDYHDRCSSPEICECDCGAPASTAEPVTAELTAEKAMSQKMTRLQEETENRWVALMGSIQSAAASKRMLSETRKTSPNDTFNAAQEWRRNEKDVSEKLAAFIDFLADNAEVVPQ